MSEDLHNLTQGILLALFNQYRTDPVARQSIAALCHEYHFEPSEVGTYLEASALVRDGIATEGDYTCRISVEGINELNPDYFADLTAAVMITLGASDLDNAPLDSLTDLSHPGHREDLAHVLNATRFFTVLDQDQETRVKLTEEGRTYFEAHKEQL